jgi:hypothetical protein
MTTLSMTQYPLEWKSQYLKACPVLLIHIFNKKSVSDVAFVKRPT